MPKALAFINPSISTRNIGDIFIEDAAKRILVYDPANSVDIDPRQPLTDEQIDRINATDAAVIVGTNLWYRNLTQRSGWRISLEQLRRIRVPVIPLGVGTTRHAGDDNGFDPDALVHLRRVHDSCTMASVRDQRTAEALCQNGIRNVMMTGCPTLYRRLEPRWWLRMRPELRQATVTVRLGQRSNVWRLLRLLKARGLSVVVAAQQVKDHFIRSWLPWRPRPAITLFERRLEPYLELAESSVGAIGCRLHGNMLQLAQGNPVFFLANCSRAQSFCESFRLPCLYCPDRRTLSTSQLATAIEQWLDPATYATLPERFAHYRAVMASFLDANGLEHRLAAVKPTPQRQVA